MLDAVADTAGGRASICLFTAAGTRLPAATDSLARSHQHPPMATGLGAPHQQTRPTASEVGDGVHLRSARLEASATQNKPTKTIYTD